MPTEPTKTELTLFRALMRVKCLPAEYRDSVLDRGMEKWFESALENFPIFADDWREYRAIQELFDDHCPKRQAWG